ncbi:hypothetical protein GCM10018952_01080 [Streptosporangium vulgare]
MLTGPYWQVEAWVRLAAHRYASPAPIEPPAKTSGYVASMTADMAPPADRPET